MKLKMRQWMLSHQKLSAWIISTPSLYGFNCLFSVLYNFYPMPAWWQVYICLTNSIIFGVILNYFLFKKYELWERKIDTEMINKKIIKFQKKRSKRL